MHIRRATTIALAAGLLLALGTTATAPTATAAGTAAQRSHAHKPAPYAGPTPGPTFNNPLGTRAQRTVNLSKIRQAIQHAPRGSMIDIASWNIRSNGAEQDLINAHKRGVTVRVIIDRGNAGPSLYNKGFNRMAAALSGFGNSKRPAAARSGTRRCISSCRGTTGIAHTKMYLFSQTGSARDVIMYGSANLTDLSASNQWNDLYTVTNNATLYHFGVNVFNQMLQDRPQTDPLVSITSGPIQLSFFPWKGPAAIGDPVMNVLNRVSCTGAAAGHGVNGRTSIRIAQTSTNGSRGIALVTKIHQLQNAGCDIKLIYAVMGNQCLKILRTGGPHGPVPFRQVVRDPNHDYVYEDYLHTKAIAISGNYAGNRAAEIVYNGSSNWTQVGLDSDETFGAVQSATIRKMYAAFVNEWFAHPPTGRFAAQGRTYVPKGVNPYKLIQVD